MKKLFFTLCALCLCGTMWGQDTQYDETTGLYYEVSDNVVSIVAPPDGSSYSVTNLVSYSNIEDGYTVPEYVGENLAVTRIGESAFSGALTDTNSPIHLVIPAYITALGTGAFVSCTEITAVTFEYSATPLVDEKSDNNTYATQCFRYCSKIATVYLNRNVTASTNNGLSTPFCYHEGITEVYIGQYVTSIPGYMFRGYYTGNNATLKTVTSYAENPPSLGTGVFSNAASDVTLYTEYDYVNNYRLDDDWYNIFGSEIHSLSGDDPDWPEDENAFLVNGIWYEPIEDSEGECMIIADQGGEVYEGEINIPETVTNEDDGITYTVTRIDGSAFARSNIKGHIIIPANITAIGPAAFEYCEGITEVTLEYAEKALLDENTSGDAISFRYCSNLETVNMYREVTVSANQCGLFCYNTSIKTINIGPRVTTIPNYFFRNTTSPYALTTVNCYSLSVPLFTSDPFSNLPSSGCTLNVPSGLAETYSSAHYDNYTDTWGEMFTIQEMSNAFAITTHDNGETAYATFYNSLSNVELFDGELIAYEATTFEKDGLVIDIVEIGNVIPKATGVVVETAEAGTYLAIATTEDANSASENNHLYGYDSAQTIDTPSVNDYYFYLLSSSNNVVGFYWGEEEGAPFDCQAHRAYLALEQSVVDEATASGSLGISIRKGNGGEDTTGISSVENAVEGATVKGIYTIQGVRVSNMNQPGLYIVDGKKVLVK